MSLIVNSNSVGAAFNPFSSASPNNNNNYRPLQSGLVHSHSMTGMPFFTSVTKQTENHYESTFNDQGLIPNQPTYSLVYPPSHFLSAATYNRQDDPESEPDFKKAYAKLLHKMFLE